MSKPSTASDLIHIALAVLQLGAAPAEPQPTRSVPRRAVLELTALLCAASALSCSLAALWIFALPMLGAGGAWLVVSAVLCAVAFAAIAFRQRPRDWRAPSPAPSLASGLADDALLTGGSRVFQRHPVLTLAAALLAGVALGREK